MIDPGRLKARLTLQAPVESDDGQGGVIRSYADEAVVWAQLVALPTTPVESSVAGTEGAASRVTITLRAGVTLTRQHCFVDGSRIYRIVAWRDRDDGRLIEIDAELRDE